MTYTLLQLNKIYLGIWWIPGWLSFLETCGFTKEDLFELEKIDENAIAYDSDILETKFETTKKDRINSSEFKKELPLNEIKESRLEFLNQQIEKLSNILNSIWANHEDSMKQDIPRFLRKAVLEINDPNKIERKIKSYTVEKFYLENPEKINSLDLVTPEQIAKALEFPFEKLIEVNKRKFAPCPFHKESRSSFYIRNNWGYCFGCQWHGTTIDFLMARDGLFFKQAVRKLCIS